MSVEPSRLIVALDNLTTAQIQELCKPIQGNVTLKVNDALLGR